MAPARTRARPFLFTLALGCLTAAGCADPARTATDGAGPVQEARDLGEIHFPTSGAPEARAPFLRGALLLHSFEYARAREAFVEAQVADRGFAMAYWGEALTHDHPLWGEEDRTAARGALDKLAPTREARLAAAPTRRERLYLEAVEALFGEGEKAERDRAYAEAMRRLSETYPEDLEAKALYALSLLGTVDGRDHETYMRAAALAEEVYQANPRHPGALHYLIHSYDDPVHARLGLRAARVYAEIAPDAVHARHMPSHIFLALGMWDDVVSANRASEAAAVGRGGHNLHALHWLMYAHLQRGERAAAREALETIAAEASERPRGQGSYYLARARANWLVETGAFDGDVASLEVDVTEVGTLPAAADAFAAGYAALGRSDLAAAREALGILRARRAAGEAKGDRSAGEARVMEMELEALLTLASGRRDEALDRLGEAVAAEEAIPYEFGPPRIPKPSHELLGEALSEAGRPAEAIDAFRRSLDRAPGRALSLAGLASAARAAGERVVAEAAAAELRSQWSPDADAPLPGAADAGASLGESGG